MNSSSQSQPISDVPDGATSEAAEPSAAERIRTVRTDCLYPSFDQVELTIFPFRDILRVSDSGGAARTAWMHGREIDDDVRTIIRDAAILYGCEVEDLTIYADALTAEWEHSARLAVANASASAARALLASPLSARAPQVVSQALG